MPIIIIKILKIKKKAHTLLLLLPVVIYERSMVRRGKWKKGTVATDRRIVLWLVY